MARQNYYSDWRSINRYRNFPFEDTSSLVSQSSDLTIPLDWLIDAAFFPTSGQPPYNILEIEVSLQTVWITVGDRDSQPIGNSVVAANSTDPVAIRDSFGTWIGTLVPSRDGHYPITRAGDGVFRFGPNRADFIASTSFGFGNLDGFYGFRVGNQIYDSREVFFVGERGVQLTVEQSSETLSDGEPVMVDLMRVHAVGNPLFLIDQCDDPARLPPRFIREVVFQYGDFTHSCEPTDNGNVFILAGSPGVSETALQIRSTPGGVVMRLAGKRI